MKKTIINIDEILDRYLAGLITEEDVREQHLELEKKQQEEAIDALIEKIELPIDILVAKYDSTVASEQQFTTPTEPNNARENFLHRLPFLMVGVVTVAMLLVAYFMFYNNHLAMADHYFKPYAITTIERSFSTNEQQNEWNNAINAYEFPDYQTATLYFKNLLNQQPKDDYIDSFFAGICHLAAHQPREAIFYLNQSINTKNNNLAWKNTAYWYLGLAYLSNENILAARQYFEKVALADSHIHKDEAIEILERIK